MEIGNPAASKYIQSHHDFPDDSIKGRQQLQQRLWSAELPQRHLPPIINIHKARPLQAPCQSKPLRLGCIGIPEERLLTRHRSQMPLGPPQQSAPDLAHSKRLAQKIVKVVLSVPVPAQLFQRRHAQANDWGAVEDRVHGEGGLGAQDLGCVDAIQDWHVCLVLFGI